LDTTALTFAEAYQPLLMLVGFLGGWGLSMLTGLLFLKAA